MKEPQCKVANENILGLDVEGGEGGVELGDGGGEVGRGDGLVVQDVPGALSPPLLHTCKTSLTFPPKRELLSVDWREREKTRNGHVSRILCVNVFFIKNKCQVDHRKAQGLWKLVLDLGLHQRSS